ncbi:MAG: hypothetical protein HC817_06320 [Saprospiraceae bacterium]|nr:hypothetical protein [Saprospiraceae bacterium]
MIIAILEIAPHGHYTYVESIAKVYTADVHNKVIIFTNEKGRDHLNHIDNEQINTIVKSDTEGYESFFDQIKGVDICM